MARKELGYCIFCFGIKNYLSLLWNVKVARYSFSGPIPPKFEYKPRRHKQRFGNIATVVLGPVEGYPYARVTLASRLGYLWYIQKNLTGRVYFTSFTDVSRHA